MEEDQNWYRQLLGLVLLAAARAAADYITNPNSREDTTSQLREAFQSIDYDAAARAVTQVIDNLASSSKDSLSTAIDSLRDRGVDAVDEAKTRAEKQLGRKKGGRKLRFLVGLAIGGLIAYFFLDEQRRDDLLDRLTGASGPIQQSTQSAYQQAASTAQEAAQRVNDASQAQGGSDQGSSPTQS